MSRSDIESDLGGTVRFLQYEQNVVEFFEDTLSEDIADGYVDGVDPSYADVPFDQMPDDVKRAVVDNYWFSKGEDHAYTRADDYRHSIAAYIVSEINGCRSATGSYSTGEGIYWVLDMERGALYAQYDFEDVFGNGGWDPDSVDVDITEAMANEFGEKADPEWHRASFGDDVWMRGGRDDPYTGAYVYPYEQDGRTFWGCCTTNRHDQIVWFDINYTSREKAMNKADSLMQDTYGSSVSYEEMDVEETILDVQEHGWYE